jgi:hypothetical protein
MVMIRKLGVAGDDVWCGVRRIYEEINETQ